MKKIINAVCFAGFFGMGLVLFSLTANAYIDPSAMTYIVQVVAGIVIAGAAAFGFYFKKLKSKLKKKNEDDAAAQAQTSLKDEVIDYDDEFDDSDIPEEDQNLKNINRDSGKKE